MESVDVCAGAGGTVAVTVDVATSVGVEMLRTVDGVALTVVLEKVVVGLLSTVVVPPFTAVFWADARVASVKIMVVSESFMIGSGQKRKWSCLAVRQLFFSQCFMTQKFPVLPSRSD